LLSAESSAFKISNIFGFALGKLGRGGTKDEVGKPLIAVQRVKAPPD
jgi:hypothetical protein